MSPYTACGKEDWIIHVVSLPGAGRNFVCNIPFLARCANFGPAPFDLPDLLRTYVDGPWLSVLTSLAMVVSCTYLAVNNDCNMY